MRKIGLFMMMALLFCGCGGKDRDHALEQDSVVQTETKGSEKKEDTKEEKESEEAKEQAAGTEAGEDNGAGVKAAGDMTEQIKTEVSESVRSAGSLQEELKKIEKLDEKYQKILTGEDGTQMELNERASYLYFLWDTELNDLWKRMKSSLSENVMNDLTEEQRRWVQQKAKIVEETIIDYKEGSIYPMFYQEEMAEVTRNRVYELASVFAEGKGETFKMPKRSAVGKYIDDQGTADIYSSLIITYGMESGIEAKISVYKLAQTEGSIEEKGDKLVFHSSEYGLTAEITYGWDGAEFKVTKAGKDSPFDKGEVFHFPKAL